MDEVNLRSGLMRKIVASFIQRAIKKSIGADVDLYLFRLKLVTMEEDKVRIEIEMAAEAAQSDLRSVLKRYDIL